MFSLSLTKKVLRTKFAAMHLDDAESKSGGGDEFRSRGNVANG